MYDYGGNQVQLTAPAVREHPGAWPEPVRRSDLVHAIAALERRRPS